jgi:hypothetical protein
MKTIMIALVSLIGFAAQADVAGPAWTCHLNGTLEGKSLGIVLDITHIEGAGNIHCDAANGVGRDVPVKLRLTGVGLGLGFTDFDALEVAAINIGVADGPEALVGTYSVGPAAGVTLIEAGFQVGAAIKVAKEGGLSFEVGFLGAKAQGLEAKIQLQSFEINPME